MSPSSSVTALALSWGIDESEVAVVGVFVIDVAVRPRVMWKKYVEWVLRV